MKTILAAIDFSPVTSRVINQAVALAHAVEGRVVVFSVTHPPVYVPEDYGVGVTADVTGAARDYALKELKRIEQDLRRRGVDVQTRHAIGHPGTLVLDCAAKVGANYIVIGSHGHTAIYDLVVGSTAHLVLKRALCPVLVVPAAPAEKPRLRGKKN